MIINIETVQILQSSSRVVSPMDVKIDRQPFRGWFVSFRKIYLKLLESASIIRLLQCYRLSQNIFSILKPMLFKNQFGQRFKILNSGVYLFYWKGLIKENLVTSTESLAVTRYRPLSFQSSYVLILHTLFFKNKILTF